MLSKMTIVLINYVFHKKYSKMIEFLFKTSKCL